MTLIIAEAGVNHNGNVEVALQLIDAAYAAGADVVKFQTFIAKKLVTKQALQADYQVAKSGKKESQLEMLSRLQLSFDSHHLLVAHCKKLSIEFLSTAFDSESLEFLVNDLGLTRLKIPSGEITNAPLVLQHARTGCDLIVSTGMATLADIEAVLGVIAFGYTAGKDEIPSIEAFQAAYLSEEGKASLNRKVTLLHCTTEYPASPQEINLRAMDAMTAAFGLAVGYSDHSEGISVPVAAVARGACLLEKHFTLDKNMDGPDHKASLDPSELKSMIQAIRDVELALGDGIKGPRPSEINNKTSARKSIVAARDIPIGAVFCELDLSVKRPGLGDSPFTYWSLQSKSASRSYKEGDLIRE
ncbi:N-acetylneuraminate synthase [Amylibacter sp.]|nr:N-acetylneuraminate synthase [Amylibacter sp.]